MEIEETKFYQPGDDVMKAIAAKQKLAQRATHAALPPSGVAHSLQGLRFIETNRM